jgi:hypothetical protein
MPLTNAEKSARYRAKDVEAFRARKRAYTRTPEQREVRRLYMQGWREKNRARHNELARESHQRNKHKHVGKHRLYHLAKKYGITAADYERMFAEQDGKCLICRTDKTGRWSFFHVDHDHATGKVRGLLCVSCNTRLGWFELHGPAITEYLARAL